MDEQEKIDRDIVPDTVAIPEAEIESTPAGVIPPVTLDTEGTPLDDNTPAPGNFEPDAEVPNDVVVTADSPSEPVAPSDDVPTEVA